MPARLILSNGIELELSDHICEQVLRVVDAASGRPEPAPAADLETLMAEFADLYGSNAPSPGDLLEDHRLEREREMRALARLP